MATPKAIHFIGEVAAFASWAGISEPVAHFDLEPRSDTPAQEAYLAMLPLLVQAAAHPTPPALAGTIIIALMHRAGTTAEEVCQQFICTSTRNIGWAG